MVMLMMTKRSIMPYIPIRIQRRRRCCDDQWRRRREKERLAKNCKSNIDIRAIYELVIYHRYI